MAQIIENDKGFKVIEVDLLEILSWGGLGICDLCSSHTAPQFYIPVLNSCYCQVCYPEWLKRAKNYPEDKAYEEMSFKRMKKYLNL